MQAPTAGNTPAPLVCYPFTREDWSPWSPPRRRAAALEVAGRAAAFGNRSPPTAEVPQQTKCGNHSLKPKSLLGVFAFLLDFCRAASKVEC